MYKGKLIPRRQHIIIGSSSSSDDDNDVSLGADQEEAHEALHQLTTLWCNHIIR